MGYAAFRMLRALALSWCLVLAGGLGLFDTAAHAQLSTEDLLNASDEERRELEARQYFELGRLAFIDGRFEEALQAFERSYELSQRALLLFNIGSAVMGPEVYLKALAMARNVAHQRGEHIRKFTTAVFDLPELGDDLTHEAPKNDPRYYFRPFKTILVRTVADGGRSFYVQGDHKATVPALYDEIVARVK